MNSEEQTIINQLNTILQAHPEYTPTHKIIYWLYSKNSKIVHLSLQALKERQLSEEDIEMIHEWIESPGKLTYKIIASLLLNLKADVLKFTPSTDKNRFKSLITQQPNHSAKIIQFNPIKKKIS